MKRALITGITGQDGSYLAELLLDKGVRSPRNCPESGHRGPSPQLWRIRHILDKLILHPASMESYASIFTWWKM